MALLMLAASGDPPRERARDQKADLAGLALRRKILDRVAALDPDPERFEAALASIVAEVGEPTGPTRGLCAQIFEEWCAFRATPTAWAWLLGEAVAGADGDHPRRRRKERRGPEPA